MALTFEFVRPVDMTVTGVALWLMPALVSGLRSLDPVEVARAPDSAGSPGAWETIARLEPLPSQGRPFTDTRPWTTSLWWYRYRHVRADGAVVSTWSTETQHSVRLLPRANENAAEQQLAMMYRATPFGEDGKYALAASADDGLTADATVKDSTGTEIRRGFKKAAHTDPDTANSVADGTAKRVVTLDEGTAVSELGLQLAQAESILMNGDFERGMRYWRRDSASLAGSTVTIETGANKYSGVKSLKMTLANTGDMYADQVDRLSDDSDSTVGNLVYIPADGSGLGWEVHGRAIAKKGTALQVGTLFIEVKQYDASKSLTTTITVASNTLGTSFGEFGGGVALGATTRFITARLRLNGPSGGLDAYVDDVKVWLKMPKMRCKVFNSAAQSITNNTPTLLTWDSEDHDIGGLHSTVSNTARITPPALIGPGFGLFLLIAQVQWAAGTTGYRRARILYNDDGSTTILGEDTRNGTNTVETTQIVTAYVSRVPYESATPNWYEVEVQHTQGAALNANGGVTATYFSFIQLW